MWLTQAQNQQKKSYDKWQRTEEALKEGDLVWISSRDLSTDRPCPKLEALRFGPFKVTEVLGPLTYKLQLPDHWRVNNVFHRSKLTAVAPPINGQENTPQTLLQSPIHHI